MAAPLLDNNTLPIGASSTSKPNISSALPTSPVANVKLEQQTLGSGFDGQVNKYGNDLSLANQMNAQAAKMKELNASPALPTPGGSNSAPSAPTYDPFSRPGDSWGDSGKRQQEYEGLMRQAATGSGITKGQRAAMMGAAQGMMAPGLAMMKQQGDDYAQKMNAYNVGSLPSNIGGSGGFNADTMKGLMSMFQTNQKPGDPPAPGATAATPPAVPSPTATAIAVPGLEVSDGQRQLQN